MSFKPFAFVNNFSTTLALPTGPSSGGIQIPLAAAGVLDAVMNVSDHQIYLTVHDTAFSKIAVIQVESVNSSTGICTMPAGMTVGETFAIGDKVDMYIPAEMLTLFRQRQMRNAGILASGAGFTIYPENHIFAAVNTGSHPITIDFQTGTVDGSAQARIVLTENSASPLGTFTWTGAGGKTIRWPGGTAPSFTAGGQDLIVDFEYAPYNDTILGSFQRFG